MERFQRIYKQGVVDLFYILVDTETGVCYLYHASGPAAGFTPLLDSEGKPVIRR